MSIKITAWKCVKCGKAWLREDLANRCCTEKPKNACNKCGIEIEPYYNMCGSCREEERYSRANKVKYSEYKGELLYDDNLEQFYSDKDELEEDYYYNLYDTLYEPGEEMVYPEYCYGCTPYRFTIDIENTIERASEEMHEDFENKSIVDLDELLKYVENWNKKQTAKSYNADYNTVVLLNE